MNNTHKKIVSGLLLACATTYVQAGFNFEQCSGSGSFEQEIISYNGDNNNDILVGTIPAGIEGLHITLESQVDVDVRLYGENNDKVVRWPDGILSHANEETKSYKDVDITYSGYNGVEGARGHEFITVNGTTPTAFTMKAFGYRPGFATVNYEWTGKVGCDANGTGSFTQEIPAKDIALVGTIPGGIENLQVNLSSDKDIDIQLYGEDGVAIIKWPDGLLNGATEKSIDYNNMHITWSGYNGTNGHFGHEYIKITGTTTEKLTMKVFGYQAGMADVTYSWGPEAIVPDYIPTLTLSKSSIIGASGNFEMTIKVQEFNGGTNTGPVKVFIPNNAYLELQENEVNEWELTTTSAGYIFEYTGNNGIFPPSQNKTINLLGIFTSPQNQEGYISIEASILKDNGEDILHNNKATAILSYDNIILAPDYAPQLTIDKPVLNGVGDHLFRLGVKIHNLVEDANYDSTNPLVIRVIKNNHYILSSTNSLWTLTTDSIDYLFTYTGTNITANGLDLQIDGIFTIEEGSKGIIPINVSIKPQTGGDSNVDNNSANVQLHFSSYINY